jgi:hypothetical protein
MAGILVYTVRNGHKNFFLYGITHVIKRKSFDNYAEKFALQILLSFLCNLMDNLDWVFFLFFTDFSVASFSLRNFPWHFTESAKISQLVPVFGAFHHVNQ